jgi:prolycopene isomerase
MQGLKVQVRREYGDFIQEMVSKFPHEEKGIKEFYKHCWNIFNR